MAEAKLNRALAAIVRIVGAGALVFLLIVTQSSSAQTGSLCGRLTDLHSKPLADAILLARNQETGAEASATTAKSGAYCFSALPAGSYTLTAENPLLGRGQLSDIPVRAGFEARVQAAMEFTPAPVAPLRLASHEIPTESAPLANALASMPVSRLPLAFHAPQTTVEAPPATVPMPPARLGTRLQTLARLQNLPAQWPAPLLATKMPASTISQKVEKKSFATPVLETASPLPHGKPAASSAQISQKESQAMPATSSLAQIDPANAAATLTLSANEVHALPASGRHWEEFALEAPAAATTTEPSGASLQGPGLEPAETSIDGVSTRLAFGEAHNRSRIAGGQNEQADDDSAGTFSPDGHSNAVSKAAVGELRATTSNASAESSRAAGGHVSITTARGGNGLHGQAFYNDRQNNWGARNPFTTWIQETTAATATTIPTFTASPYTPPSHEISGGIGVGRQLRRDKLYWFVALDGMHNNDPGVSTVKHPELFFLQPTNDRLQLLGAQVGSGSLAVPKYSKMLETLDGLLGPAQRTSTQGTAFGRFDWKASERSSIMATLTASGTDAPGGGLTRTSEPYGNHSYGNASALRQRALGRWEFFLTPNLLATSEVSYGHTLFRPHPSAPSSYEQTLDINVWNQLPQIVIDSSYGFTIGNLSRFGQGDSPNERSLHAQQALQWVHGAMLVSTGVQFEHAYDRTTMLRNQTGTYHYANVANFVTDALAFASYGIGGALDADNPHTCDQRATAWRDSSGTLQGNGSLPCYSYYTQTMGPTHREVSTNEWAGYATAQWQPRKSLVLSAGLRWEREQLPPPIASLINTDLPLTAATPSLGNNWGPRFSLAWGGAGRHGPTLRLGYGLYYGRLENRTLMTALAETGSTNGNLYFYLRPTDNRTTGGAPPFPYVFAGEPLNIVKPGAIEFAPGFRNAEVHQAIAAIEQELPGKVQITAAAILSLGRHLPVTVDTNIDASVNPGTITYGVVDSTGKGPIKAARLTVPLYASWPSTTTGTTGRANTSYQQIVALASRANSTYEAAMVKLDRYGRRGLSLHAHYTYAHAMDWNPNEGSSIRGTSVLDPNDFGLEYGVSNLDARHSATAMLVYTAPWKLRHGEGKLFNNWMLSGIGRYHSGLPYTIRTSGSLPKEFTTTGSAIVGLGSSINGLGGDNRIYGTGNDGLSYNLGRNTYRYPYTWKADLRLAKSFHLAPARELQLLAESFNLFNHQNVTEVETTGYTIESGTTSGGLPSLNFMTGTKTGSTAFGAPLNVNSTNFYRERQIELGLRLHF
jgi:hypothetical protein